MEVRGNQSAVARVERGNGGDVFVDVCLEGRIGAEDDLAARSHEAIELLLAASEFFTELLAVDRLGIGSLSFILSGVYTKRWAVTSVKLCTRVEGQHMKRGNGREKKVQLTESP